MSQGIYLKTILALSLLATIALPLYTGLYIYPKSKGILIKHAEHDAIKLAKHLSNSLLKEADNLTKELLTKEILQEIEVIFDDFKLYKIKIFTAAGEVIYSSNPVDIGNINIKDYLITNKAQQ